MLEKRVEVLEQKVDRILDALERVEFGVRDLVADNKETRKTLSDIQLKMATRDELKDLQRSTNELAIKTAAVEGQIRNIPSTWQMITTVIGSQVVLAGLLFTALKFGLK